MSAVVAFTLALAGCKGIVDGEPRSKTDVNNASNGEDTQSDGSGSGEPGSEPTVTLEDGTVVTPLPARVRRLTNSEYDSSVKALLGTSQELGNSFPVDARQKYFTVNAAQRVDPVLADQLKTAAETLAKQAVDERLETLVPCAGNGDEACATQFIRDFGRRAFRRPLSAEEQSGLLAVYNVGRQDAEFRDGIELVINAVLQAPGFLYVTELGTEKDEQSATDLEQFEVASQLAYVLTGAPPDDELLALAEVGQLATAEQREAQARRLLELDGSRAQLRRFVNEWLGMDNISRIAKSQKNSAFKFDEIRGEMTAETNSFIDEVMQNDGASLHSLLGANYTTVSATFAPFYGLTSNGSGRTPYGSLARRGVLTQASFLAAHSPEGDSGPIKRGIAVYERVLCQELAKPEQLNIVVVPPPPNPSLTTRERFAQHSAEGKCRGCHDIIDPLGFAFEHYDAMGAYRDTENGKPVDSASTLSAGLEIDGEIASAVDLADKLSNSELARSCFARQMFRFASAQNGEATEESFLGFWEKAPRETQDNLRELLIAYVKSEMFVKRSVL